MPRTLVQAAAFLIGLWFALWLGPLTVSVARSSNYEPPAFAELEASLYREVNALRRGRHLIPLERSVDLDRVARAHSRDMAQRHFLAHQNPDGLDPVDRLRRAGIAGFSLAAENAGQTTRAHPTREIVHGWLESPSHRNNLHAPPFNTTGVGVARASDGTFYYTQLYLTFPRS